MRNISIHPAKINGRERLRDMATQIRDSATTAGSLLSDPIYARVRERLREEIVSGEFPSGVRLKIIELSKRYGVSPMPVREALQKLEGEGLVVIEANRGARVRNVDENFINNMYDIRAAIDSMLVRRAAERMDEEDFEYLRETQAAYEDAAQRSDFKDLLKYNQALHDRLHTLADNPDAKIIIERPWGLIDCLRLQYGCGPDRTAMAIREHRELLEAIADHNADRVERLARNHTLNAKKDLIEQMRKKTL